MPAKGLHQGDPSVDSAAWYDTYEDTGCDVSPKCLRCPLAQCKFDDPKAYRQWKDARKYAQIIEAVQVEGLTAPQAAKRFGVGERTAYRVLRGS